MDRSVAFIGGLNFLIGIFIAQVFSLLINLGDHVGVSKELGIVSPLCHFGTDLILLCRTDEIGDLCFLTPNALLSRVRSSELCKSAILSTSLFIS